MTPRSGNPDPASVLTQIEPAGNTICWASPARAACYHYTDEGTHLAILLTEEY